MKKKKKVMSEGGGGDWMTTYSDMVTLLLCFFAIMFNPNDITQEQIDAIRTSVSAMGMGAFMGGNTLSAGKLAELGNTSSSMPSMERGKVLGDAQLKAVSLFAPEIRSNKVRLSFDERGLVISLVSDAFFNPASTKINIEESREILLNVAMFLSSDELNDRKLRIEGHTDSTPTDPKAHGNQTGIFPPPGYQCTGLSCRSWYCGKTVSGCGLCGYRPHQQERYL